MGEAHVDVLLDRLRNRFGVAVDQVAVRVPLRETFAAKANGHGRHVKQSGGHGQFAVCDITVEPLEPGGGFEFVDKVVGGSVPRQFIPSVEKGVRAQLERGRRRRLPGRRHQGHALRRQGAQRRLVRHGVPDRGIARAARGGPRGGVSLLEPIDEVDVLIDDDYMGAVMGDLSTRRARVIGTEPVGTGRTLVRAEAPQLELVRYATELRSLSHGTGTFSREFARYEAVPSHIAAKLSRDPITPRRAVRFFRPNRQVLTAEPSGSYRRAVRFFRPNRHLLPLSARRQRASPECREAAAAELSCARRRA